MRPQELTISGWGPYKDETIIDFTVFEGRGLFLVTGATGAGKTTIFDAITYALYGSLSGEIREKTSVRSDFADPDTPTYVKLTMQHAGKVYRIDRNPEYNRPRKRGKGNALAKEKENAILYLPDGRIIEGIKEVNAKIQEILVLDYLQFKQITMIAQGEFARLLTASPKDKTRIFRDIFGTGIYERFTKMLRIKSTALYEKVMEQRHKSEEDLRFLLTDTHEKEMTEGLETLTKGADWNYGAIAIELSALLKKSDKKQEHLHDSCKVLQLKNETLTAELTQKTMENEQIDRLLQAERTLNDLKLLEKPVEGMKAKLASARAAERLIPYRVKVQAATQNLQERIEKTEGLEKEIFKLVSEKSSLALYAGKGTELQGYLEVCRQLAENRQKKSETEQEYKETIKNWEEAKVIYLKEEQKKEEKKEAYTQADQKYRYAAIGIAARMLKAGEPCPVCGSREHPSPAKEEEGLPSEQELKRLKAALDAAEETLIKVQERATTQKTLAEEREKQLCEIRRQEEILAKKEEEECKLLFTGQEAAEDGFFTYPYTQKVSYIQKKTERLKQVEGMLLTTQEQLNQAKQDVMIGKEEEASCREALQEALLLAGFESREKWEAASLEQGSMRQLEEQIRDYTDKMTAAKSVKAHLEETLSGKTKHDTEALLQETKECRILLEEEQQAQKKAHAFYEEAKKTKSQFLQKQKIIEKANEEYGYVKDLENLASGNNKKRLVFEQYVLAGYFEEILRAANLRFLKMTGGRYQMSRVEEAGDGRVKDSLEIQVMDYYTGKTRSVKTLSGGESFKASLCLALGMSDVIQSMNGGIKVDTLFIDEGFGALDTESLDQACETLMGLVEHSRLIGIISHVPELRERIDSQLIIEKTNSGSRVKIHV